MNSDFAQTARLLKNVLPGTGEFSENCTQEATGITIRELKSLFLPEGKKKAIKPHDRLVLVR